MTEQFLEVVYRDIEEKIAEVNLALSNGTVQSMEHYKQLYGRKEGLEVAYSCIKLVYKKFTSPNEDIENRTRHDGKSSTNNPTEKRSIRSFY